MLKPFYQENTLECGLDEVARGCLFGRVYASAVIWPQDSVQPDGLVIKDSKALSARKRLILYDYIKETAIDSAVAFIESDIIDKTNILAASINAMHLAIKSLDVVPESLLIDGENFYPYSTGFGAYIPHHLFPKGDGTYMSIACASILAKVEHDKYIADLVEEYPELKIYNIESNQGYGTAKHIKAIEQYGCSPWHRRSFSRVKEFVKDSQWIGTEYEIENWRIELQDKLEHNNNIRPYEEDLRTIADIIDHEED